MRTRKGEYVEGKLRGYWFVCVFWEWGSWQDNDKHHLGSLIMKVHQSSVRPVCLRKSSTDGLGLLHTQPNTHTLCLILLYHFSWSFILPANFQPYRGHLSAVLLYKQEWSTTIHLQRLRPPIWDASLSPPSSPLLLILAWICLETRG